MLHLPGGAVVAPEWSDLAGKLVQGDGLNWTGDPSLELRLGVIEYRGRTGRRLEVWRTNEDGSEAIVGHWRLDEAHRVCFDLAQMRVDRPGFAQDTAEQRIDRHNDSMSRAAQDAYAEKYAEMLDHMARLYADTTGPRTRFYLSPSAKGGGARA